MRLQLDVVRLVRAKSLTLRDELLIEDDDTEEHSFALTLTFAADFEDVVVKTASE